MKWIINPGTSIQGLTYRVLMVIFLIESPILQPVSMKMSGKRNFHLLIFSVLIFAGCTRWCGESYIEKGDLDAIAKRGRLRIILPSSREFECLPRRGTPLVTNEILARKFAEELGLHPDVVLVDRYDDIIEYLLDGRGDIIAAPLTVTQERRDRLAFSSIIGLVKEQVVTRAGDDSIKGVEDLAGRRVAVRRSSSYFATLQELKKKHPEIEIMTVDEHFGTERIIQLVAQGRYEATVADSDIMDEVLIYCNKVRAAIDLTDERPVAWAVRPGSKELLQKLNAFIGRERVSGRGVKTGRGDLPEIKNRKVLRVLTRNNAVSYFIYRGELVGFEYDLALEFAKRNGLAVSMIVPPRHEDLIPWLKEGRGDVVAAALTLTEDRKAEPGVSFSRPYNYVSEMLVARADESGLEGVEDLEGRTIVVRSGSSYRQTLEGLKGRGIGFRIGEAPADMETEEIIDRVARGEYDLTLADSHILDIELTYRDDIKGAFALTEDMPQAWAVRAESRELLAAVNSFFDETYKGLFYNMTYNRYFGHEHAIKSHVEQRASTSGRLSPYDGLVKKYADRYAFDWRLITAQMYQESRFDPEAVSWAGAIGLMQILPGTAMELGFKDITSPAGSIHAGVKYLYQMRSRFDTTLPLEVRENFALASYNVGWGHVLDAQRLAEEAGLKSDMWFDNVEKAMLMLSKPEYYSRTRYGYCRGSEPVKYVREIRHRYNAYMAVADN